MAAAAALLVFSGLAAALPFRIQTSLETETGDASPADFLSHWQFVGASASTTSFPVPRVLSATLALPTRLARASGSELLNRGVAGDTAALWTFNETVGIPLSAELEIDFTLDYVVGTTAHTFTAEVYVETQARAPARTLTFSIYWDSGGTGAVTFVSELELTQLCSAVGTCP